MEPKRNLMLKSSMTYGLYLGIAIVIYSIILYIFNVMPIGFIKPMIFGFFSLAFYVVGIIYSTKKVRSEVYAGEVTYSQALIIGFVVAVVATMVSSVYSYIQNAFIDPEYMVKYLTAQKEWTYDYMSSKGISGDQLDKAIEKFDEQIKNFSSLKTLFTGLFSGAIFGLIISLITSAFLKKKTNPLENPNV